jgi:shikimate dehydrogenase
VRLELWGDPVAHSRSPAIHNAALTALGMSGDYLARRVDGPGLQAGVARLRSGEISGANVTMPHKAAAAALADHLGDEVTITGAANTLRGVAGRVEAINTDVGGLVDAASAARIPADIPVLVLGAGGSAAAAVHAFGERRPAVAARRPEAAAAVLEHTGVAGSVVAWGEALPGSLIINATPLGMRGERLPPAPMVAAAGLIDLPYGSAPTPACRTAAARGIPYADGIDVLVAQAARAFSWWTGRLAPVDAMRVAARA